MTSDIQIVKEVFLHLAGRPNSVEAFHHYAKKMALPMDEIWAHVAAIGVAPINEIAPEYFGFFDSTDDEVAVIIEPLAFDCETPVDDLIALPINFPDRISTLTGELPETIGEAAALNPASYHKKPCPVWEAPLRWLQSGCQGVTILRPMATTGLLCHMAKMGQIAAENSRHASLLASVGGQEVRQRVVIPNPEYRRAA